MRAGFDSSRFVIDAVGLATILDYTPLYRRLYVTIIPLFLLQPQRKLIISLRATFYNDT